MNTLDSGSRQPNLGRPFSALHKAVGQTVNAGSDFVFQFNIIFTREVLYGLDRVRNEKSDLPLAISAKILYFIVGQGDQIMQGNSTAAEYVLDVKLSDWLKLSYDWSKDMILVPMSPETNDKIKKALKENTHCKNINELFDELIEFYNNRPKK